MIYYIQPKIYSAAGEPFTVDLGKLSAGDIAASWFGPRTGTTHSAGNIPPGEAHTFTPPTSGADCDWLLTLDMEAAG